MAFDFNILEQIADFLGGLSDIFGGIVDVAETIITWTGAGK